MCVKSLTAFVNGTKQFRAIKKNADYDAQMKETAPRLNPLVQAPFCDTKNVPGKVRP